MKTTFQVKKRQVIYSGRVVHLEKLTLKTSDRKTITRELIRHGGAAVIIPVLPGEKFVLVYQHRIAAGGWLFEFPAGTLEKGERPKVCAARELIEETGYQAKSLTKLVDFLPAPGISTEQMHLYLATNLRPTKSNLDHDEFIEHKTVSMTKALQMIQKGEIRDAKSIVGILWTAHFS